MVALASNSNRSPSAPNREIDAGIVEAELVPDPLQRGHRLAAKRCRHVGKKARLLLAMAGLVGHVGGEIMHLPVSRYRKMQRIDGPVDHHHAVFSRVAVAVAGIEIFDRQQFVARKASRGRRQIGSRFDQDKIAPGVVAGRAQQQRKRKPFCSQATPRRRRLRGCRAPARPCARSPRPRSRRAAWHCRSGRSASPHWDR